VSAEGTSARAAIAERGEDAALRRYVGLGYRVLARNWRCRLGEIDLVLARGATLVVCEVKTRRGTRLGAPFDAVNRRKQAKLRALAEAFLGSQPGAIGGPLTEVRFDVASVLIAGGNVSLHVFEDAF